MRQYALLSTLLKRSFGDGASGDGDTGMGPKGQEQSTDKAGAPGAEAMDVDGAPDEGVGSVDVTLTVHPAPRLQVVFPLNSSTANVGIEIGPSGRVRVTSQNILPEEAASSEEKGEEGEKGQEEAQKEAQGEGAKKGLTVEKLGRALEVLEDIDQWCEWIRTRVDSA